MAQRTSSEAATVVSTGFGNDENLYPLVICYIVIEHGPSIVDLPIIKDAFP